MSAEEIISQLDGIEASRAAIRGHMAELSSLENNLLIAFAKSSRVVNEGTAVLWRGLPLVVKGIAAYRDGDTISLVYGLSDKEGNPIASAREDNLLQAIQQKP